MERKIELPQELSDAEGVSSTVRIYLDLVRLKWLYRQGWLQRRVPRSCCESVAEHSFAVAILAMLMADSTFPELDREKLLGMALLHEFGEIDAGDLTPRDGVEPAEKHRREQESVKRVLGGLSRGASYVDLWREYAEGRSAEARFLREVDRLEMGLQAVVYEHQGHGDLGEFLDSAKQQIQSPELQEILAEIITLRTT